MSSAAKPKATSAVASMEQARGSYEASGCFVLRTPLLPVSEWTSLNAGLSAPAHAADSSELAAALQSDHALVSERLARLWKRGELREAVFLASPTLTRSVDRWCAEKEREPAAAQSWLRYFTRMATRPTPFGLFAGYSTGSVGEVTALELAARSEYRRRTRLDMECVSAIASALESSLSSRGLRYRANSSLYEAAGRLRYVEDRRDGRRRTYHLVAVESSEALATTLERARTGATLGELAAALVGPGVSKEDADGFLAALVERRILVSELEPALTGDDALEQLVRALEELGADDLVTVLRAVGDDLARFDRAVAGNDQGGYAATAERIVPISPAAADLRALFQVDLEKPCGQSTLGSGVCRELERAVHLLHRISAPRPDALADFKRRFSERYEEQEVPLVEALDAESGIGFGGEALALHEDSPLLAELPFPPVSSEHGEDFGRRDVALMRLLERVWRDSKLVLELADSDIEALAANSPPPLPDALAVLATVLDSTSAAEPRLLIHSATGPSGARLLGRFCARDPRLTALVRAHVGAEEALRPSAVFAEIVCHPQDRVGNVLARPLLRRYEIPYLGRSGAPAPAQIPVTDLWVRVVGERVVLRSRKLGCEVLPRLSTAHFYGDPRNPSVYRFLGALQSQGVSAGLSFSFGPFEQASFLPRVTYQNLVLSRARWNVSAEELQPIRELTGAARFAALRALRARRSLPRHVVLAEDDNELPLDLENVVACEALLERPRERVALYELLTSAESCKGPEGLFEHELIVPFVRRGSASTPAQAAASKPTRPALERSERTFCPGSEWLYAKVYGGEASLEGILTRAIAPLRRAVRASGAADSWFFLRYSDPDPHLRVRFHGEPSRLSAEVLPAVHAALAPFVGSRSIVRVEIGTYEREVERYGGLAGVRVAERLFDLDSDAALEVVERALDGGGDAERFELTIAGMDALFQGFSLDLRARSELATRLRDAFALEFRADVALKEAFRERFRGERARLEALLSPGATSDSESPEYRYADWIAHRKAQAARIAEELRGLESAGQLECPMLDLVPIFAHLFVNRTMRSTQRAHEYLFYELLSAHYRSALGRARAHGRVEREP